MKKTKENKGITLIALIVTIIILLILGGVSLKLIGGSEGILSKVQKVEKVHSLAEAREKSELLMLEYKSEKFSKGTGLINFLENKVGNGIESYSYNLEGEEYINIYISNYITKVDEKGNIVDVIKNENGIIPKIIPKAVGASFTPDTLTNKDVMVTLPVKSGYTTVYTLDGTTPNSNSLVYVEPFNVDKNLVIEYCYKDSDNIGKSSLLTINNIDKLKPNDFEISVRDVIEIEENKIYFEIVAETEDAIANEENIRSGIDKYEYYIVDSNNNEIKYTQNEISLENMKNFKIYAICYDNAGNTTRSEDFTFEFDKLKEKINIIPDTSNWSKEVNVDVDWGTYNSINKKISIDNGATYNDYTGPIKITKNTTVKVIMQTDKGRLTNELKIENIDRLEPKAFTPQVNDNISSTEIEINAETTDQEATSEQGSSGINGYIYYVYYGDTLLNKSNIQTKTNYKVTDLTVGNNYKIYVEAIDNAGNVRKSEELNYIKLEIYKWEKYYANITSYNYYKDRSNAVAGASTTDRFAYTEDSSIDEVFDETTGKFRFRNVTNRTDSAMRKGNVVSSELIDSNAGTAEIARVITDEPYLKHGTMYVYYFDEYRITKNYEKIGTSLGYVTNQSASAYPDDGEKNGYWYVKVK